ncbi:uncharacterized protein LOC9639883 isoform X2 [Selaginella moellendorffii]|uniref:uncharacterized protein LOC9639883 isoform X2 n=1 Tax=Selaginella moellendorffii TaxID=88036 RepID=UPI000D1C4A7E|nr:uncharacterized protein LOC9639883 isoform X2 [Selaginella moellendorffii]|eukprot:XP_024515872.1 uncharacterized protein LOC9639883 isoform X2 [Selaginella moellendorffii]
MVREQSHGKRPRVDGEELESDIRAGKRQDAPERSIEQQIEEVESEIRAVQQAIEQVEQKVERADQKVDSTQGELQKHWMEEKKQLRELQKHWMEEKKQLREKEKQLRQQLIPSSGVVWSNARDRIAKLKELFGPRLKHARTYRKCLERDSLSSLPTGLSLKDIGQQFPIVGREKTVDALLRGNWLLYKQFMSSQHTKWDVFRRLHHIMGVVGFPGAGKTSLGTALPQILIEMRRQRSDPGLRIQELASLFDTSTDEVRPWDAMMSTVEHLDVLMYHDFISTFHGEAGLGDAQVLALRTLHAAVSRADGQDDIRKDTGTWTRFPYQELVAVVDAEAPDLKKFLLFDDVIALLREVCELGDQNIFLSFFFDEIGRSNVLVQKLFRQFIVWKHRNVGGKTFVTMLGATNIFTAASLRESGDTGSSEVIYIPVNPLSSSDREKLVLQVFNKVLRTSNREELHALNDGMQLLCKLSGGNPRLITFMVQALASDDPDMALDIDNLALRIQEPFLRDKVRRILDRVWSLCTRFKYYNGFAGDERFPYLLRAIQASMLREHVSRNGLVLLQAFPRENVLTWEALESCGVVAVVDVPNLREEKALVEFSPVLLHKLTLQREDLFGSTTFDLTTMSTDDWKQKEDNDFLSLIFSIYIHKLLSGDSDTFMLADVLPCDWYIPDNLKNRKFRFPTFPVSIKQLSPGSKKEVQRSGTWAICGPRNSGADTFLILKEVKGMDLEPFLLYIQSKCFGDPLKPAIADWSEVVRNLKSDVRRLIAIKDNEQPGDEKYARTNFGYVFFSDKDNSSALSYQKSNPMDIYASSVIIGSNFGMIEQIAAVRHTKKRPRKM